MKEKITDFLSRTEVGETVAYRNLAVFPVRTKGRGAFAYLTLDEALEQGKLRISEAGPGGHVPELMVRNVSDERIFLMDGEELVGAKQNRILNTSIIVDAGTTIRIPVSCVEEGRWSTKTQYMGKGAMSFPELRMEKARHVHQNLQSHDSYDANQSAIWGSVSNKLYDMDAHSCTSAMNDVFKQKRGDIARYADNIDFTEEATGVVAALNGRLYCADLFESTRTLKKMWRKLISSYAMDAIGRRRPNSGSQALTKEDVVAFLDSAAKADFDVFNSPGLGKDVRFKSSECIGSALVCDDSVVHLTLFKSDNHKNREWSRLSRPSRRFYDEIV